MLNKMYKEIEELRAFIAENSESEDATILIEAQAKQNKLNRLQKEFDIESKRLEAIEAKEQAITKARNKVEQFKPSVMRLENLLAALSEITRDDLAPNLLGEFESNIQNRLSYLKHSEWELNQLLKKG